MTRQPAASWALRDYQREAIDATLRVLAQGAPSALIVLPTGGGKTLVMVGLIQRLRRPTLLLAHRRELVAQAVARLQWAFPADHIGVWSGRTRQLRPITVASVGALHARVLTAIPPEQFAVILTDEAHHAVAASYRRVYAHFSRAVRIGVTATPERADGRRLGTVFQRLAYYRSIPWMIERGYLVPVQAKRVAVPVDWSTVPVVRGDYADRPLARLLDTPEYNAAIVHAYRTWAVGRKAMVFVASVAQAHHVAAAFQAAGVAAAAVDGAMPPALRDQVVRRFSVQGDLRVLVNCALLTEGFDEPSCDAVLVARPTLSAALYLQMVGRGLRKFPGKRDCLILDFVTEANLAPTWTLPRIWPALAADAPRRIGPPSRRDASPRPEPEPATWAWGIPATATETDWLAASPWYWSAWGGSTFALALGDGSALWVETDASGQWARIEHWTEWRRQAVLVPRMPLADAIGWAEAWAGRYTADARWLRRGARWRQEPATAKQRAWLDRHGIAYDPDHLTKGQASELRMFYWYRRRHGTPD